jgi:hypothetical protein
VLRHSIRIGPAPRGDAARLLEPKLALDRETSFTMLEPGERRRTPAERALELDEIDGRTSSLVLVADGGEALPCYAEADGGRFRRHRHSAHVAIGVRQDRGRTRKRHGASPRAERPGGEQGVRRLEPTVMAHTTPAPSTSPPVTSTTASRGTPCASTARTSTRCRSRSFTASSPRRDPALGYLFAIAAGLPIGNSVAR